MRIAIVGPTHPYKGGIPLSTTDLAHHLQAAGHHVEIISWAVMYPSFLYPGEQFVPGNEPEIAPFEPTSRHLRWYQPFGWWRAMRRVRRYDHVIFVWWVPTIQGPVYLTMMGALGRRGPKTTVICHNVIPHEPKPGDKQLAAAVLKRATQVLVHTEAQAEIAEEFVERDKIRVSPLPLTLPGIPPQGNRHFTRQQRLLFFGIVRHYKGLDVLLRALAQVPEVQLLVAGEFWGDKSYDQLIEELGLVSRVELRKGYLPASAFAGLFQTSDTLVLPYRGGTATQNAAIGHAYGVPVIATTAGSLASQVRDGVDGLLCAPDDVEALAAAIRHFYEPGVAEKLTAGVPAVSPETSWQAYLQALGMKD